MDCNQTLDRRAFPTFWTFRRADLWIAELRSIYWVRDCAHIRHLAGAFPGSRNTKITTSIKPHVALRNVSSAEAGRNTGGGGLVYQNVY